MSSDQTTPEPAQLSEAQELHGISLDWHFQSLVKLAHAGLELGVTLIIDGITVSGLLIGGKKYFDLFIKDFKDGWPQDDAANVRTLVVESFQRDGSIYDDTHDQERPDPQFFHLKDARIFLANGTIPSGRGTLWRGRINSVSAFSLGLLNVSEAE